MENLRNLASTSGTATLHPLLSPGQVQLSKVMDGSSWLHVQVCRDFLRGTCTFSETQCNFAHPQPHIKVRNNHINACYDNIKGTCNRIRPPCKYFHPPEHIKEELVVAGRQHLALKKALIQKMAACEPGQPFNTEEVFEGETKSCKSEIAMPNIQKKEPEEESENKLNTKQCRYVEPSKRRMKEFIEQNPVEMGDTMSLVRVVSALLRRGNSSLMFKTPESLCPVEPVRLSVPHESLCKRVKLVTGTNVPMKNAPLCFGTKVDEGQVEIFTGKESTVAPAIKNAFKAFQNFVKTSGKPLWDPRTSTGFWQGISLRCNSAGEVMLHATVMGSSTAEAKEIMEELTPKLTQFFSWGRGQPSKVVTIGISIVPDEEDVPHLVMGKGYLDEVVMNMRLRLFRQTFMWNSHTSMNDVCEILAKICSSQRIFQVLQLGCNPGLFGHYLSRVCETVHGIDERPIVDAAAITAQENDIFNCHYRDGDAWKVLPNLEFELKHGGDTLAILHDESCHIWNHDVLLLLRKMPFVRKLVYLTSYSSDFIVDLEILSTMQEEMVDFFHPTNVVPIQTTTMSKDHLLVFILDKVEDTQARDRAVRMSYDTFRSVEGDLPRDRTFTGSLGKKANFNKGREIFSDRETVRKDERRIFPCSKNYENRVRDISKRTSPQRAIDTSRNNTDNNRSKISPFKEIKSDTKKNFTINRNRKTSQDNDRCRGRFNDRSKDRRISPAKDKNAGKRSPVRERSGGGISPANERSRNKRSSPTNDRSGNRKSSPTNDRSGNSKSSPANDRSGNSKSSPANDRNRRKSSPANGKSRNRESSPACDRSRNRKSSPACDRSRNRKSSPANDRSRNKNPANDRSRNKSPVNDRSRNKSPVNDRSRNKSPANDRSRNKSPAKDRDQNKGNHTNTHKEKDIKSIPYSKNQGKQSSTDEIKAGTSRSRVENKQKNIGEQETADQHANNASASTPRNVQEMKAKFIKFLTSLQEEEQEKKPTAQSNESTDNVIANTLLETLQEIFPTSKLDVNTANMLRNTILDAFKSAGVLEKKETITIETTESQSKTQCKIDPKFPKENIYSSVYRKIRRKMLSGTPTNSKTSFKPEGQSDSQILKKSTELADSLFAQCLQTNFASKHFKSKNELSSYFLKPISKRSIRRMSLPLPSPKKPKTEPLSSSNVSNNPPIALIPSTVSSNPPVALNPSKVSSNPPVALISSTVSSNLPVTLNPSKVSSNPPVALISSTVSSNPPVALIPSKVSSNPPVALISSTVSSNPPVALIPSKVSSNPSVALSQIPSTLPFPPHFQMTRHTAHASAPKKDSPLPLQRNLFSNFKSASQSMLSSNDSVLFDPRLPPPPLIKASIIASSPFKSHNTTLSTKDLPGMIPGMKHQLAGRYSTEDHFATSYSDRKLNSQVQSHIPHSNIKETNENHRVEHTYNSESVEEIAYFNKPSTMSNVYSEAKDVPFIMDYKETHLPPSNVKPSNFPNYQFKDSPHDRFSQHEFSPPKKIFRGNTFLKHREDSFQSYDHSESVNTLHRFEPYTPRHDNIFTRRSDHSHIREHTARYDQMEDVNASLHSPWEVRNDLHSHVQDNLIRCDTLGIESANRQHMLSQEPERYADYRRVGSFPSRLSGTTQENVQLYHKDSFHQDISRRNAISHMQDLLTKHNILLPVKSGVSDPLKRSDPPSMNLSNIRNVPKQHYSDSFENRFTLDRSNSSIDICEAGFLDSNRIKHYSQISNNY